MDGKNKKSPGQHPGLYNHFFSRLEQTADLSSGRIHVDAAECRVGAGAGHQADGSCAGAEEFGAGVDQDVADRQSPSLGDTLFYWVVGQAQMGFDHHGGEISVFGIVFQHFGFGIGFRSPIHTIGPIDFLGDEADAVAQFHFQWIEEFEIVGFVAGIDNCVGELQGTFATLQPVVGFGTAGAGGFGGFLDQGHFRIGIGIEPVDANDRVDAGFTNDADHVDHVLDTLFEQSQILFGIGFIQGFSGHDLWPAAMHFQGADRRSEN